jgi:HAD superfamily phosphatase (TIGR01668 family)
MVCRSIYEIDGAHLAASGIRLLIADLDNTLVPYYIVLPTEPVRAWAAGLKAHGIELFILSNSRSAHRAERFCSALGVPFLSHAGKPRKKGFLQAMEQMGAKPEETIMVGDQFFYGRFGRKMRRLPLYWSARIDMRKNPPTRCALFWSFRSAQPCSRKEGLRKYCFPSFFRRRGASAGNEARRNVTYGGGQPVLRLRFSFFRRSYFYYDA